MTRHSTAILLISCLIIFSSFTNVSTVKIGLLKYNGGGDWYANPTSLPNLIKFCNNNLGTNIETDYGTVEAGSSEIFNYPLVHLTGHGNVLFSNQEVINLKNYLLAGGFLHIDDNYGLDEFIRREMKKVFPDQEFIELPFSHPIYHQKYHFNQGLPKVHEHDKKPSQGFGLFHDGRLICFYSYESDLGDGWEDPAVHGDSEQIRRAALEMGANIVSFVFKSEQ